MASQEPSDEAAGIDSDSDSDSDRDLDSFIPTEVVEIDPRGDLKLKVVLNTEEKLLFVVCSRALARASRYWEILLYGEFKEAKQNNGEQWVVRVEEDDPYAFHILVLLVHGRPYEEECMEAHFYTAFEATVLADKYQMNHCLWGITNAWLQDLEPPFEDFFNEKSWFSHVRWLWMTQQLGDLPQYRTALTRVVFYSPLFHKISNFVNFGDGTSPHGNMVLNNLLDEAYELRSKLYQEVRQDVEADLRDLEDACHNHLCNPDATIPAIIPGHSRRETVCTVIGESLEARRLCDQLMQHSVVEFNANSNEKLGSILNEVDSLDKLCEWKGDKIMIEYRIFLMFEQNGAHALCTPMQRMLTSRTRLLDLVKAIEPEKAAYIQKQAKMCGYRQP